MGRKKTSPGRQAEGQITSDGADGKKTGRRKKRWRSIRKKTPPKNPAKPWFSNRQIYVGFGTVLTQVPDFVRERVNALDSERTLKELHRRAVLTPSLVEFRAAL